MWREPARPGQAERRLRAARRRRKRRRRCEGRSRGKGRRQRHHRRERWRGREGRSRGRRVHRSRSVIRSRRVHRRGGVSGRGRSVHRSRGISRRVHRRGGINGRSRRVSGRVHRSISGRSWRVRWDHRTGHGHRETSHRRRRAVRSWGTDARRGRLFECNLGRGHLDDDLRPRRRAGSGARHRRAHLSDGAAGEHPGRPEQPDQPSRNPHAQETSHRKSLPE